MRPASNKQAPDPSNTYERSHPERESGMGDLDAHMNTPVENPDRTEQTVGNRQDGSRQLNAHEVINERMTNERQTSDAKPPQPDHSMKDEEPMGSDQSPTDIHNPQQQRHPRTGGKGGTPDAGEPRQNG
jgi:hypothetical protein